MRMEKKMTKKDWFAVLANVVEASEMKNKPRLWLLSPMKLNC